MSVIDAAILNFKLIIAKHCESMMIECISTTLVNSTDSENMEGGFFR